MLGIAASAWLFFAWRSAHRTVADSSYEPASRKPLFSEPRPLLLFDEAHRNHHRVSGTYQPFARLATAAGITVRPLSEGPRAQNLESAAALMIVTAQGPSDPGSQTAFTAQDIGAIRGFVAAGGGLILVVDHYPFADAAHDLAGAFGVQLARGMIVDAEHADRSAGDDSQLVFSRANRLLASHAITDGPGDGKVGSVVVFTGVSMSVPPGATGLLLTGAGAKELVPSVEEQESGGKRLTIVKYEESRPAGGEAMAIALEHGRGRVVILGDSAMLTAQYDRKTSRRYGLSSPGFDNERFAWNLLRWVVRQDEGARR